MTASFILLVVVSGVGILLSGIGVANNNRSIGLPGLLMFLLGFVGLYVYVTVHSNRHEADIKARTVVVRGSVEVKTEIIEKRNGRHFCSVELKELPYTFSLSSQNGWEGSCNDIHIRDLVKIKFVRPVDWKVLSVDAREFLDLTYEMRMANQSPTGDR